MSQNQSPLPGGEKITFKDKFSGLTQNLEELNPLKATSAKI